MVPAKVDILRVLFAYSGNGGVASTIPQLVDWWGETLHKMKADPRIGRVGTLVLCDTPITMTRNQALAAARDGGFDFLLMLDSDNEPDGDLGRDPGAKPFWDEAFNLAYDRLSRGKQTIVAAPYCGPPPNPGQIDGGEVPYLFQWENNESGTDKPGYKLRLISRHEAALMRGIHRVAALPTGCCLLSVGVLNGMAKPYFYYEFDEEHAHKNSTEDVVFTRNASLRWQQKGGDNICFATCDSWAYHHKTKVVGRPTIMPVEAISEDFRQAVMDGHNAGDMMLDINPEIPANAQMARSRVQSGGSLPNTDTLPPPSETRNVPPSEPAPLREPESTVSDSASGFADCPIVHRNVGGQMVTTDARWPLTEADAAAITKLVESLESFNPRIVALNVGLGDNLSVLLQAAWIWERFSTFASAANIHRDAYAKNMASAGLGAIAACPEVDPDPSDFDNQELDLLWVGHPVPALTIADDEYALEAWVPHVKRGGLIAGIGYGTRDRVAMMLHWFVRNELQIERVEGTTVWFVRIPIPLAEASTEVAVDA